VCILAHSKGKVY